MTIRDYIPKEQFRYYFTQLENKEQQVYLALLEGMLNFTNSIKCLCSVDRVQEIYHMIKYDIPEIFYVKTIKIRYISNGLTCTVVPTYRFNVKEALATLQALDSKYSFFISHTYILNDFEKEKAIHDLIATMVKYKDVDAPYSHEAPGTLLYGIGVCEGISKAFKYLADRVGLKSIVVIGTSNAHGNDNGHAWNAVEIGNIYYHLDVTFDTTIADGCLRYDYFNLSDDEIKTNHSWTMSIPKCLSSYNYYYKTGAFFSSKSELAGYIRKMCRKNNIIVFQVPMFEGEKDVAIEAIRDTIRKNIICSIFETTKYFISYNTDRMVFQICTQSEKIFRE